jgi:hypothetical protein
MAHIVPVIRNQDVDCFEQYVDKAKRKFKGTLPDALIETEEVTLRDRIENLSKQITEFLDGPDTSRAWLVLGKVQSGKTSHLLGMVSYAATKNFALASLFTGVNHALNQQGVERIQKDLSETCAQVFEVPTSPNGSAYQSLKSEVLSRILTRTSDVRVTGENAPLPVLVTLKTPERVKTLGVLLTDLQAEFSIKLNYLMIDDEADQASQNGKAQKSELSKTYEAISALRATGIKHAMLAYTATPQAVLLSEREGLLRPDRCVTVPPKRGYFGLDEFLDNSYAKNLVVVDDVGAKASTFTKPPESLEAAFLQFLMTTYLRRTYPTVFYGQSLVAVDPEEVGRMLSTQFMIHESSANKDQSAMFHLFQKVKTNLDGKLRRFLGGEDAGQINAIWTETLSRLGTTGTGLPKSVSQQMAAELINLMQQNKTLVVNADSKSPTFGQPFPVKDAEWEVHSNWTLIGGDILGRGLTIPQLTVSYFLRTSKKPNFDTVSQQMRFCGYRTDYARATSIHAHQETIDLFRYMQKIEGVVWRHARKWDRHRTPLTGKIPPIMYAAPLSAKLEPTRKNVRDPNLRDIKKYESSELLYSARHIFNPAHVFQNVKSIRDWFLTAENSCVTEKFDGWTLLSEISESSIQNLIPTFITAENNKQELRAIAELFDDTLGDLGLSERPSAVYIKSSLIESNEVLSDPQKYWAENSIRRAVSTEATQGILESWLAGYGPLGNATAWGSLSVPHVGDGQRALVRRLPYEGTVIVIEPLTGSTPGANAIPLVLGVAFTMFKPKDFEIRMIGHA